jgi:flagellar assembly factor FliW
MKQADYADPVADVARIRVKTRFGEFDADPRDILNFPDGLPGFEQCHRFVVLSSMAMAPLQCLHAVDGPPATFLAIDPRLVLAKYRCTLGPGDLARLGGDEQTVLLWLALVTVGDQGEATVNLRAPVVINPSRMNGFQVVPSNSLYPLRYPLTVE